MKKTRGKPLNKLKGGAFQKALNWVRDGQCDGSWWHEEITADAKKKLSELGMHNIEISWGGFYSQGDGASCSGRINLEKLIEAKPELVANNLPMQAAIACYFTQVAICNQHNRYFKILLQDIEFEYSEDDVVTVGPMMGLSAEDLNELLDSSGLLIEFQQSLLSMLEGEMASLFNTLRDEYEYGTSDEACIYTAEANDWRFNELGEFLTS